MSIIMGVVVGFVAWFLVRYLVAGIYTVNQNERAVKTSFGRAERVGKATTLSGSHRRACLSAEEKPRYDYPAGARHPARRALFQMALGDGLQGERRHPDREHGL